MDNKVINNLCKKMGVVMTKENAVGFIMLPPLLTDYAKQMLDEKKGMFKQEQKRLYNLICEQLHKYFIGVFSGLDLDQSCKVCDMQDDMAEAIKKHVTNLNYAIHETIMHVPTEVRKEICDMVCVMAIIETSSLVAERIMRRKDNNLHAAHQLTKRLLELMYKPYQKESEEIDLNKSERVNMAAEIFVNKIMQYQKIY